MVDGYGTAGYGHGRRNRKGEPRNSKILAVQNFQYTYLDQLLLGFTPLPVESFFSFYSQLLLTFSLLMSTSSSVFTEVRMS